MAALILEHGRCQGQSEELTANAATPPPHCDGEIRVVEYCSSSTQLLTHQSHVILSLQLGLGVSSYVASNRSSYGCYVRLV